MLHAAGLLTETHNDFRCCTGVSWALLGAQSKLQSKHVRLDPDPAGFDRSRGAEKGNDNDTGVLTLAVSPQKLQQGTLVACGLCCRLLDGWASCTLSSLGSLRARSRRLSWNPSPARPCQGCLRALLNKATPVVSLLFC